LKFISNKKTKKNKSKSLKTKKKIIRSLNNQTPREQLDLIIDELFLIKASDRLRKYSML
jgi:hypothetical protein